ncbi:MAG: hypothetical protein NT034_03200 [Candidatus Magasanikbacteria bacterium]|nr:hypothetical protein [Candidatus Magasanikbacteria bacterium]
MKNNYIMPALAAIVGIVVFAIIILFVVLPKNQVVYVPVNNTSTPIVSPTTTPVASTTPVVENPPEIIAGVKSTLFTSKANGFEIWYPQNSQFSPTNDIFLFATKHGVAKIMLAESLFKGTNLVEAGVGIGVDKDVAVVAKCTQPVADGREKYTGTAILGGVEFSVFEGTDGAAGHMYEYKNYRAVKNGRCYELVEAINSVDIGVYEPGTMKEFNKNYISGLLEKIVSTFGFVI